MKDIVVIKCGGSTIEQLSDDFFKSIKKLKEIGFKPVIVHGGGPAIKNMLTKLKVETEFVNGLRKTTSEVMEVVEMVLSGPVNKSLVRKLESVGVDAVGVSGSDHHLIEAEPKDLETLGYVGDVTKVNANFVYQLLNLEVVPVIAPVAVNKNGTIYNVNADTAAGAVAKALHANKLIFVTDVPGILKDKKLLETVTEQDVKALINNGTIYGGMIPKVEAALYSLEGSLEEVMIVDGKHSSMVQDGKIIGTTIKSTMEVV
ncbi:acetylglutamate kinase [Bacillus taeanensis]|uniref:Acetylglutamate kinase n=1 Tax=Bacillus taeanensis TaxID=273032 RepID=A0A366XY35_9BACI|nr:acetylglutamate kinase [Bacillus taeanensis]RBW71052.1 acetylglutamate kinase [Bacillus taeanensis]